MNNENKILSVIKSFLGIVVFLAFVFVEFFILVSKPKLDYKSLFLNGKASYETYIDNNSINVVDSIEDSTNGVVEDETQVFPDNALIFNPYVREHTKKEQLALPQPKFATCSDMDFEHTLFIGDSRMVGFTVYKRLYGATYFAYESYGAFNGTDVTLDLPRYGTITLSDLLSKAKFDKIYICLGVNNLAASPANHSREYKEILDEVYLKQPQATIYLLSNMHVTDEESFNNDVVNNENINAINEVIKSYADNERIFYLDPNYLFDDENGNLRRDYSNDRCHIHAKHYDKYLYYILTHVVKR